MEDKTSPPVASSYELLLQSLVDTAIYLLDVEGNVANWNAGAERLTGYGAEEIIGRSFELFHGPEDLMSDLPEAALTEARQTGRYVGNGWRIRKDGTRFWANVVLSAVRGPQGELLGYAKCCRDMSELRETELKLQIARDQLFQSQKMDALGQLTGGMAHDFNNLLTGVLGGADMGLRHIDNPEKLRGLLNGIYQSAERGAKITQQLLAFARKTLLEPKIVDMKEQLGTTSNLLRQALRADIPLTTNIPDDLWAAQVDPNQLDLALVNLTINSRDAMVTSGALKLDATNVCLDGSFDGLVGNYISITLTDTGTGIAPEIIDRIFEPFFTTKGFGQGTGLGLSQVYGFAKQSNGSVKVDSVLRKGTTVTIYIPAADLERVAEEHRSVLIVEDEVLVGMLAADMFSDFGYEAVLVHSADEALEAINKRNGKFTLIFSDIVMPGGLNGLELTHEIRRRYPEVPILLTTGYSQSGRNAMTHFPVVQKPYSLNQLQTAVERLSGKSA